MSAPPGRGSDPLSRRRSGPPRKEAQAAYRASFHDEVGAGSGGRTPAGDAWEFCAGQGIPLDAGVSGFVQAGGALEGRPAGQACGARIQ